MTGAQRLAAQTDRYRASQERDLLSQGVPTREARKLAKQRANHYAAAIASAWTINLDWPNARTQRGTPN